MAETAGSLVTDALGEAFINAQEQPTEAVDMSKGIRYMNRFMAELDSKGVALGYTIVSSPDDAITVPDGAINGMVFNLAMKLANSYGEPVGQELRDNADSGLDTMYQLGVTIEQTQFGGTTPVGSGNEGDAFTNTHFFPDETNDMETETNGNIILESST